MPPIDQDALASSQVRRPVLKGRQRIAGLWFPADWFDVAERRRRIVANWRVGASVFSFADLGDLLRYPVTEEIDCENADGWPLQLTGRTLCSAPLESIEISQLPVADAWIVLGGNVLPINFSQAMSLDPSEWIDVESYGLLETYDCHNVLPLAQLELPDDTRDLREILGSTVPTSSPEKNAFMQAVQKRQTQANASLPSGQRSGVTTPGNRDGGSFTLIWAMIILCLLVGVFVFGNSGGSGQIGQAGSIGRPPDGNSFPYWLIIPIGVIIIRLLSGSGKNSGGRGSSRSAAGGCGSAVGTKAPGSIPERAKLIGPQRWRDWLERLAMMTQVSRLLGRQQAAYVKKMLEMFESGKLDEALRHAIPLGGENGSLGQSFGTPGARKDLALSQGMAPSSSINFGEDLNVYLRHLYRQSFEKLDRERRIDEAVFVLGELLQSRQEALDYLEKHERYAQAAELALAWDRPSNVIVRLHCLAGDWRKAVAVARRDKAFAEAVQMLENKWPDPARRLRLEWAETLGEQGDWLGAVEAIWPIEEARERACAWLRSAEAAGGHLAARALVKRAILLPDTLDEYADYLGALRDDAGRYRERTVIADALLTLSGKAGRAASLARILVPQILADQARGVGRLNKKNMQRLLTLADNKLLNADLPNQALPVFNPTPLVQASDALEFEVPEPGSFSIFDAVALEHGRFLVALGEMGPAVVGADGKTIFRFAVPAQKLVIARSSQIALALIRRGDMWRVSRIDLANRKASDLGMLSFDFCATEFDGIAWTVVEGSRIRVIDTTRSLQTVLWQVTDLPGTAVGFAVNRNLELLLIESGHGKEMELWRYSLPQRRLIGRDSVAMPDDGNLLLLHPISGTVRMSYREGESGEQILRYVRFDHFAKEVVLPVSVPQQISGMWLAEHWLLLGLDKAPGLQEIWLLDVIEGECRARLKWSHPVGLQTRVMNDVVAVFDQRGRLFSIDTSSGEYVNLVLH